MLISKTYQELRQLNIRKKNKTKLNQKWAEDLNQRFSKEHIQAANRHMERCSTPPINKEMQSKQQWYRLTAVRTVIISQISIVGDDVKKREHSYSVGGRVNWCIHYGKEYGGTQIKTKSRMTIWSSNFYSWIVRKNKSVNLKRYIHPMYCSQKHYIQ